MGSRIVESLTVSMCFTCGFPSDDDDNNDNSIDNDESTQPVQPEPLTSDTEESIVKSETTVTNSQPNNNVAVCSSTPKTKSINVKKLKTLSSDSLNSAMCSTGYGFAIIGFVILVLISVFLWIIPLIINP